VARAVGYKKAYSVSSMESLQEILPQIQNEEGPLFLQICVKKGNRKDLGRPTTTPVENKKALMEFLGK
jgi:phosphonopyruvate decarboxylase